MSTITSGQEVNPSLSERRREASRELMRAEILTAAQHIIRTQGMDALSLRAIAKAVGVTAPALYDYFPNKDAILRGLFVQGSQLMLTLMDEQIAEQSGGLSTLLAILDGYRAFARTEPDFFLMLFGTVDPNLALSEDEYAGMQQIFDRFIGVIVQAIDEGTLQPLPAMVVSCSLWALVHGVAMLETESFLARKKADGEPSGPQFDAAVKLVLLNFATPNGAEVIGPIEYDCD